MMTFHFDFDAVLERLERLMAEMADGPTKRQMRIGLRYANELARNKHAAVERIAEHQPEDLEDALKRLGGRRLTQFE